MMIDLIEGKKVPPVIHTDTRIMREEDLPDIHRAMGEEY
jgi:ribose transport system substrate-binding protein